RSRCASCSCSRPRRRGALQSPIFRTRGTRAFAPRQARLFRVVTGKLGVAVSRPCRFAPRWFGGSVGGVGGSCAWLGPRVLDRRCCCPCAASGIGLESESSARVREGDRYSAWPLPCGGGAVAAASRALACSDA